MAPLKRGQEEPSPLVPKVRIMPRTARKLSRTNIYHVMLRGINRQTIFEDNEDRYRFMTEVRRCKELSGFRLYAFCLMSNHVHLLIETGSEPLELVFKRLGSRYAGWYNRKYDRVGHLFQDRFRSEPVETTAYFLTVLRYILQNPMRAGMEVRPGSYKWSSYLAYEKGNGQLTDIRYASELIGQREELVRYLCEPNNDKVWAETMSVQQPSEEEAKAIMEQISNCSSATAFQALDKAVQKEYIKKMAEQRLSVRQISRITGRDRKVITRIIRGEDQKYTNDFLQMKEEEAPALLREVAAYDEVIW